MVTFWLWEEEEERRKRVEAPFEEVFTKKEVLRCTDLFVYMLLSVQLQ